MKKSPLFFPIHFCVALLLSSHTPSFAEILVKPEQKVAFLGDSITYLGTTNTSGYVRLVEAGLKANGVPISVIGAGISGNKSDQMLARLQRDVLDKKPDWLLLSCGVNDVWHGVRGVPLDQYKKNITEIVDRSTQAGVKVMILTATVIYERENDVNTTLTTYNAFLKELAAERKLPLADLNTAVWAEIKTPTNPRPPGANYLTVDGVHMGPFGDAVMATGVLGAFGLDAAQLKKAREVWEGRLTSVRAQGELPIASYRQLAALAVKRNMTVEAIASEILTEALKDGAKTGITAP